MPKKKVAPLRVLARRQLPLPLKRSSRAFTNTGYIKQYEPFFGMANADQPRDKRKAIKNEMGQLDEKIKRHQAKSDRQFDLLVNNVRQDTLMNGRAFFIAPHELPIDSSQQAKDKNRLEHQKITQKMRRKEYKKTRDIAKKQHLAGELAATPKPAKKGPSK